MLTCAGYGEQIFPCRCRSLLVSALTHSSALKEVVFARDDSCMVAKLRLRQDACKQKWASWTPKRRQSPRAKNLFLAVRTARRQEQVDMVAGDFNGAWRRQSGNVRRHISSIEEALANTNLPIPPGPAPFACTVRSEVTMKLSASNLQTRAATTKYGFISCSSAHDWWIAHPVTENMCGQLSGRGTRRTTTNKEKRQS